MIDGLLFLVWRDMNERGRPLDQILHQYITYVKPAFEEFCLPVSSSSSICRLYFDLVTQQTCHLTEIIGDSYFAEILIVLFL